MLMKSLHQSSNTRARAVGAAKDATTQSGWSGDALHGHVVQQKVVQQKVEKREDQKSEVILMEDLNFEATAAWRRLTSKAMMVTHVAMLNQAVQDMSSLNKPTSNPSGSKGNTLVPFEEVIARNRLTMSQDLATVDTKDPRTCKHTKKLFNRGNAHALWYTCQECGARWPRKQNETVLPPNRGMQVDP